jgi:hypothetical protein
MSLWYYNTMKKWFKKPSKYFNYSNFTSRTCMQSLHINILCNAWPRLLFLCCLLLDQQERSISDSKHTLWSYLKRFLNPLKIFRPLNSPLLISLNLLLSTWWIKHNNIKATAMIGHLWNYKEGVFVSSVSIQEYVTFHNAHWLAHWKGFRQDI